jgi:hypothetical protein
MSKRSERVKKKKLARKAFLVTSRQALKRARANQAAPDFGIYSKPKGGKWRLEYNSPSEACRDSMFEILKERGDLEIRRVNI